MISRWLLQLQIVLQWYPQKGGKVKKTLLLGGSFYEERKSFPVSFSVNFFPCFIGHNGITWPPYYKGDWESSYLVFTVSVVGSELCLQRRVMMTVGEKTKRQRQTFPSYRRQAQRGLNVPGFWGCVIKPGDHLGYIPYMIYKTQKCVPKLF